MAEPARLGKALLGRCEAEGVAMLVPTLGEATTAAGAVDGRGSVVEVVVVLAGTVIGDTFPSAGYVDGERECCETARWPWSE